MQLLSVSSVAFCFYNLSSIVNGLVYFDQFSLLPTTHLCFVMLGMIILLAGVWIVSLPPSGGVGVDITRWDEQQANVRADQDVANEVYEDEPLPMVPQRTSHAELSISTLDRVTSDPHTHTGLRLTFEGGASRYGSLHVQTSPTSPHTRMQTDSALLSQNKPSSAQLSQRVQSPEAQPCPRPRAASTLPPSSPVSSQNAPQYATGHRQSTQSGHLGYSFPLSPSATPGTLGGGFSIGLSPISPGFALVPRRKRRRTGSSVGEGLSPPIDDMSSRGIGRGLRDSASMRRVISDGGVHSPSRPSNFLDDERTRLLNGEGHGSPGPHEGYSGHISDQDGGHNRAKDRWKWLRGVFSSGG